MPKQKRVDDDRDKGGRFTDKNTGKPKGAVDKFTSLKQAFLEAFEELGGKNLLVEVANKKGGKEFFLTLIARMLPKQLELSGTDGLPLTITVVSYKDAVDSKKKTGP